MMTVFQKNIFPVLTLCLVILTSCGDDDSGPAYSFDDQDLQGEIQGQDWVYLDGEAEESFFFDDQMSIELIQEEIEQACGLFYSLESSVFFSVPYEEGLFELNLSGTTSQTVTLYVPDETLNIIATGGAVEILSISETEISGRIDARYDEDNFINGNFTIPFCTE